MTPPKPKRGGARPGAGRRPTTGRRAGRAITLRVSDDENRALTAAAGDDPSAVGRYLRARGLASTGQLAIEALTVARVGSVAPHTTPITEVPLVRCRLVGAEQRDDGSAALHLDVGGTAVKPAWRVVIEVPNHSAGPAAGKE